MKPVRLEILIDDKTLQGLNSVKGNLGGMEQFYKQILGQLKAEITDLQKKMKIAFSEGINTDKQAAEIQALTGVVNQLNDELEKLEQTKKKNNATPIIGQDPAPKFNNIKMSMAQIARELPSITMGPQMFFLAISNNLPILQDALVSARKEFADLTAKGQAAIPVWKQVGKAIISPQALLAVGITLLVTYSDEIMAFVKKLFKMKETSDAAADAQKRLNKAMEQGLKDSAKEVAEMELLYKASQDTTRSLRERKSAVEELQNKFPSYFGNMDKEAILAGKAATAYDKLKAALIAQAQARAIQGELTELASKKMEAEEKAAKARTTQEENAIASNFGTKRYNVTTFGVKRLTEESKAYNQATEDLAKYNEEIKNYDDQIDKLVSKVNVDALINDPSKGQEKPGKEEVNYAAELTKARIKAQRKLEDMLIDVMTEGFEKRKALNAQHLREEIDRINAEEDAQLDAIQKARKAGQQVDKDAENKVASNAQQQRGLANKKYMQDTESLEKEFQEKSLKSWIAYYEKYGTYAQQRVAIIQKYALKMNNTQDENEKALFGKQQEEELQALDEKFGKSTKQMTDLFEDASKKSVKAIQEIIDKYEALIDFYSNKDTKVTEQKLFELGFTKKDLEDLETGKIEIADVTDRVEKLNNVVKGESPFKKFAKDLDYAFEKIKKANGDTEELGLGLSIIGKSVKEFLPALQEFSSNISTIFGYDDSKIQAVIGAVGGLGETAAGIGQAMSGDVVGGLMKTASGIATMVKSLEGAFGADYSSYEKMKEQYELLNDVWDNLIDKKKEYIAISYGEEAKKAGEEAKQLINDQMKRYRELIKDLAGSGAGWGSHSLGVRINKRMASEDWKVLSELVGKTLDESSDLWDLTAEQLERILQDPKIVSVLGKVNEDFLTYIQEIIDAQDELEEVEKSIQEQLTQTSFDNMKDSFWDTLLEMGNDAEAFGEDLSKTMQKAIIKANIGKVYEDELQKWYEKFAKANQDGIDETEYKHLQDEYNAIVEKALKDRNALMELYGWKAEEKDYTQSGRAGATTTITEETAGRLEGIGNAQLDKVIGMSLHMESMSDNLTSMASSMATVAENSEYLKRLDDIADNIQNMNNTGIKIK